MIARVCGRPELHRHGAYEVDWPRSTGTQSQRVCYFATAAWGGEGLNRAPFPFTHERCHPRWLPAASER